MKKKTIALIAAPLVAVLGFVGLSGFKEHGHDWRHGHGNPEERAERMVEKVSEKLDLTEVQKTKLIAVKDEMLAARKEFREDRLTLMDQLIEQIKSPALDEGTVMSMIEQRKAIFEQITPRVVAGIVEFHASLDDAQKAKIAEKLERWREHAG